MLGRILGAGRDVGRGAVGNARRATEALAEQVTDRRILRDLLRRGGDADAPLEHGDLSPLSPDECRTLLATRTLGRLAYVARAGTPDIAPVNYVLDGEDVLIHSGPGPKLQAAERGELVAVEVDDIDEGGHTGWSVVVLGRASRLDAEEQARLETRVEPTPWARGPRRALIRVTPVRITGRRLS